MQICSDEFHGASSNPLQPIYDSEAFRAKYRRAMRAEISELRRQAQALNRAADELEASIEG